MGSQPHPRSRPRRDDGVMPEGESPWRDRDLGLKREDEMEEPADPSMRGGNLSSMEKMHGPGDRPPRILLVEDSAFQRRLLRQRLESEGVEILEAGDGLEGLTICHSNPPDLVLLDLNLPHCDGFEMLRRLKDEHRTS